MSKSPRITLIARSSLQPDLDWRASGGQGPVFTESIELLRFMLERGMQAIDLDVERILIDRAANDLQFLDLLTALPEDFGGDVLQIREDGTAYLSASGRGGGRVLYSLGRHDVRFYLETHDIVTGRIALDRRKIA